MQYLDRCPSHTVPHKREKNTLEAMRPRAVWKDSWTQSIDQNTERFNFHVSKVALSDPDTERITMFIRNYYLKLS